MVLVEANVEVLSREELTTLVRTDGVIGHIDDDAEGVDSAVLGGGALQALHERNLDNLRDTDVVSKLGDAAEQTVTHLVLEKQDLGDHVGLGEPGGVTGSVVVVHSADDGVQDVLGGGLLGQDNARSVEAVLLVDRADALLLDLVLGGNGATVTNEDGSTELLLKHDLHLAADVGDDIKVSDVQDVVPIQPLLLIDGGRRGGTLQKREDLVFLLIALDVTASTGLVGGDVGEAGADTGEGGVLSSTDDSVNPISLALDELRGVPEILSLGEQSLDLLDTICIGVSQDGILQGAAGASVLEDGLDLRVSQDGELLGGSGALKHVLVSHSILSCVGMGGVLDLFGLRLLRLFIYGIDELSNDGINRRLLLLGHPFEDLPESGVILVALSLIGLRLLLGVLDIVRLLHLEVIIFVLIAVRDEVQLLIRVDDSLDLIAVVAMLDGDLVDEGTRVGAAEHQAHLDELAVDNVVAPSPNMGGIDTHRLDVAVLDHLSSGPATIGIVEVGVGVDAVLTNLKVGMPQDVLDVSVLVLPNKRNSLPVVRRESPVPDYLVIRAPNIVLRGVAREIALNCHFDYSPSVRKLVPPMQGLRRPALRQAAVPRPSD